MVLIGEMMEEKISVKFMVEDVVGCKWSLTILDMLEQGINRPGQMTRDQDGLSTKVLNERLKKLLRYKVIHKNEYNEIPPRVEYVFTDFGLKFLKIIKDIRDLENQL